MSQATTLTAATAGAAGDAADPAVRLTGLTKTFGRPGTAPVIDGIDLTVDPGEFVCLLGASGCGKSTLLNIIAGLERPTTGTAETHGPRPALMFQEHALFPWLTAGRNIELALRLRGVPKPRRAGIAAELLDLVRLGGAQRKRVHELSGGMRQRVALARALAQSGAADSADSADGADGSGATGAHPPLLLMDEPFAALDAITRDVLHDELTRIRAARPLTVVFVTHNVREAVRLGERVVLLTSRPGRIAREWRVDLPQPRRIESAGVADLSLEITDQLREEIRRHGRR
ncbi:sulfate ABC transporter ATP-binding protein [Mangrovactinospora gilvigrisea]|uniref:Sulfate ABC transporter ATP-binding protein n=1 Tax=Mangrovactinospora gilvigrisea TaxID=1428644 RepID=A0A1J7BU10_9ACTN|nr:ABC transporter ATP-binding protein [Mangrovactinospora gilvigrisea]OIV36937.1 sulfate ABC transporter ATP-binding protein [Mangrovactinospora gilvigrisea]